MLLLSLFCNLFYIYLYIYKIVCLSPRPSSWKLALWEVDTCQLKRAVSLNSVVVGFDRVFWDLALNPARWDECLTLIEAKKRCSSLLFMRRLCAACHERWPSGMTSDEMDIIGTNDGVWREIAKTIAAVQAFIGKLDRLSDRVGYKSYNHFGFIFFGTKKRNEGLCLSCFFFVFANWYHQAGLGGDRDTTNVFESSNLAASVITTIGEERMAALGGSLETIAEAKAGITKHGRPVRWLLLLWSLAYKHITWLSFIKLLGWFRWTFSCSYQGHYLL